MDIQKINSEIRWYTDEIAARKRDLEKSKSDVRNFEAVVKKNEDILAQFKRDLVQAQAEIDRALRDRK